MRRSTVAIVATGLIALALGGCAPAPTATARRPRPLKLASPYSFAAASTVASGFGVLASVTETRAAMTSEVSEQEAVSITNLTGKTIPWYKTRVWKRKGGRPATSSPPGEGASLQPHETAVESDARGTSGLSHPEASGSATVAIWIEVAVPGGTFKTPEMVLPDYGMDQ